MFYVGSTVSITGEFTNRVGVAANPTTTTIRTQKPKLPDGTPGAITTYTGGQLTNPTTGTLYVDVIPDEPGEWNYDIVGTGAVAAVWQSAFVVIGTNIEV